MGLEAISIEGVGIRGVDRLLDFVVVSVRERKSSPESIRDVPAELHGAQYEQRRAPVPSGGWWHLE